jgi:tetratricopeptide (TPR) repeat protein
MLLGLGAAVVGGLGLVVHHGLPPADLAGPALGLLASLLGVVPGLDAELARALLAGPVMPHTFPVFGLGLVATSLWPGGAAGEPVSRRGGKRRASRIEREAEALARRGARLEAADLCYEHGLLDPAARHYEAAQEWVRAAEVRHDQNRFLEAAELYGKAGRWEAAGTIWAAQSQFQRAAECYAKGGRTSVAGEMYEKAGEHARAGECFAEAGFHRQAAQCYVRAQSWEPAARALERVLEEESPRLASAEESRKDHRKLVLQAARLYEEAGRPEAALAVLERGGCPTQAGEIAMRLEQFGKAADLFQRARDGLRAAQALQRLGDHKAASRTLGEYHRDKGDDEEAAAHLEEAGELLDAGDIYRKLEKLAKAGACYERAGDPGQAAEMYRLAGDPARAAACFESAGRALDAAQCWAEAGDPRREADLLVRAGRALEAGERYHAQGLHDEAIKVLQQIAPGQPGFVAAAALLGGIFRARGLHSLAIKKLSQATEGREPARDDLGLHYSLATAHESAGELAQASELYEKILALDFHHADVSERLARLRAAAPPAAAAAGEARSEATTRPERTERPGRYEVLAELGRGGMGIVYKARDTVLDRVVAWKVLPDALKENPQALRNLLREAKAAAQLNHPNIVTIYDAGEQDGRTYIAMEFVDGTTLKEILRRRKTIPLNAVVVILTQMCEALAYAHEKKIVHRDVKTANTMWTRDRKAKIMDFGLAKVVEEVRNHTTLVSGTPYYMSPEQTLGRSVDHRTDLYSLGVTAFELATGVLPFREGNVPYHHVHTPAPDPRELCPELPAALAAVISRCLRKDPAERHASARELASELRSLAPSGSRGERPQGS